jgi:hypothetical protein
MFLGYNSAKTAADGGPSRSGREFFRNKPGKPAAAAGGDDMSGA